MEIDDMYMVTIIMPVQRTRTGPMIMVSFVSTGLGDAQEHADDYQKGGAQTVISKIVEMSSELYEKYKNS